MRKYFLYALIDPNLKIPKYIGISNDPKERLRSHLKDLAITKKTKWIKKLKEGGQLPILKVLHESENVYTIIDLEKKAIAKYKDIYGLTNTTTGGEYYAIGVPIKVYNMKGTYLESYSSMIEYAELHNLPITAVSSISTCCLRKRNYAYNHIFRYVDDKVTDEDLVRLNESIIHNSSRSFMIMDIDGNILGKFNSIGEAVKQNFGSRGGISEALSGKRNSAGKNIVCYDLDDYKVKREKYLKGKSKGTLENGISQYDFEGNYVATYYSINSIQEGLKLSTELNRSTIKACCNGKYSLAYGYQWRYGDSKENIGKFVKKPIKRKSRSIKLYTKDGTFIKRWKSSSEAALSLNVNVSNIRSAANGSKKSAYGYIWKYGKAV